MSNSGAGACESEGGFFPPTVWSTILTAKEGDEASRLAALGRMVERYRRPVVREIQWRLQSQFHVACPDDKAEELAQEFFVSKSLRENFLKNIDPTKGTFRAFVRRCVQYFLADKYKEGMTQSRGAGAEHVSLQATNDEGHVVYDPPAESAASETEIDKAWARQLLNIAMERLREECKRALRPHLFDALQSRLTSPDGDQGMAELSRILKMEEGAVRTALFRMRQRFGEIITEEVQATVGSHDDWRLEASTLANLWR